MSFRNMQRILALALGFLSGAAFANDVVRLGGVGSVTPLLEFLAQDFHAAHPALSAQISPVPLGTAGSLRALAAGKLDIAITGRMAKEGDPGVAKAWIRTPLVLASKDGAHRPDISLKALSEIYAGRLGQWDDKKPISLILRGANESETTALKALSDEVAKAVELALQRPGMTLAENDLDALMLLEKTPGSLGTTSLGLLQSKKSSLKVFSVEGNSPTVKNLVNSRYPWFRRYWLVTPAEPGPTGKQFLGYLQTDRARKIIEKYGYLPE